jgi:hypothetical protein
MFRRTFALLAVLLTTVVSAPAGGGLEGGLTTTSRHWTRDPVPTMIKPSKAERAKELAQRKKDIAAQVAAAVWENNIEINGQPRRLLKAWVSRRYKDADGQWKTSTSFSRNEIPLVIHCLHEAFEFILQQDKADRADTGNEG